jgi:hypothetical protein
LVVTSHWKLRVVPWKRLPLIGDVYCFLVVDLLRALEDTGRAYDEVILLTAERALIARKLSPLKNTIKAEDMLARACLGASKPLDALFPTYWAYLLSLVYQQEVFQYLS